MNATIATETRWLGSLKRVVRRHWPWCRIRRLRAALDAATNVGIYPKSVVGGNKPYEKRTEYMEGWNASQMKSIREAIKALEYGDWDDA